ncbi:hypothetical protein [Pseudochryseolinea flava]|uniref:hypothetical protein n=1 Tax=Pseudochryseolinea flava TaxID=2059302 RepID=UPI000DD59FA5|nr:hypothetical protein [Pseudochryseolinea flava]
MKKTSRLTAFCFTFLISLAFPIAASLTNIASSSIAYTDIIIAIILIALSLFIHVKRSPHRRKGSRKFIINLYKGIFSIPMLLLIVFITSPGIKWDILLIGLAWRFWLLSLILEDLVQIHLASRDNVVSSRISSGQ